MGVSPEIPVDEEFGVTFPKTTRNTMKQYVQKLQQRLQWANEIAKEHIDKGVSRRKAVLRPEDTLHGRDSGGYSFSMTKSIRGLNTRLKTGWSCRYTKS